MKNVSFWSGTLWPLVHCFVLHYSPKNAKLEFCHSFEKFSFFLVTHSAVKITNGTM